LAGQRSDRRLQTQVNLYHCRNLDLRHWGAGDGLLFKVPGGAVVPHSQELGRRVVRQGWLLSAAGATSKATYKTTAITTAIVAAAGAGAPAKTGCYDCAWLSLTALLTVTYNLWL
jgi:hypothetical protein